MKILVIGGGGREHAIVWKLSQSPRVTELYCAPGNGGIASLAQCVDIGARDITGIIAFAKEKNIDLTFVAPDDPLADGMVDALEEAGCPAFGPSKSAARIEGSKSFAKQIMAKYGIATAHSAVFGNAAQARAYIAEKGAPIVVKADGLAMGKGVFVCMSAEDALQAVDTIMVKNAFGEAGRQVVIEEYIEGPEVSLMCFTDGHTVSVMPPAQDHKRVGDFDIGPNTGGMGAFAPSAKLTKAQIEQMKQQVLLPAIRGMAAEGCPFKGILYAGLMLTKDGVKVLEFNARFGDPETQAVLPLLKTDLLDIIEAIREERLAELDVQWHSGAAASVVMASGGYPGQYAKGYAISGIDAAEAAGALVFHSGTKLVGNKYFTSGGRVLGVTAVADQLDQAIASAYAAVEKVGFKDCHYRRDIGRK